MSKDKAAEYPIVEINGKRYLLDFLTLTVLNGGKLNEKLG